MPRNPHWHGLACAAAALTSQELLMGAHGAHTDLFVDHIHTPEAEKHRDKHQEHKIKKGQRFRPPPRVTAHSAHGPAPAEPNPTLAHAELHTCTYRSRSDVACRVYGVQAGAGILLFTTICGGTQVSSSSRRMLHLKGLAQHTMLLTFSEKLVPKLLWCQ